MMLAGRSLGRLRRRYLGRGSLRGGRGGSRVAGRVGSAPCCTHVTTRVCVVRALPPRHDWHDWQRDFPLSAGRLICIGFEKSRRRPELLIPIRFLYAKKPFSMNSYTDDYSRLFTNERNTKRDK